MLNPDLIPTPLISGTNVKSIPIEAVRSPSRFRPVTILLRLTGWLLGLGWIFLTRTWTPKENARRFRAVLEKLGGFWIKLGQFLSMRSDVFSETFCAELSKLQDQAAGFPYVVVREIVEKELGDAVETFFEDFETKPIAAASIAQIHRAYLRTDGTCVVVKVQRPEAAETLRQDLALIRTLFRLFDRLSLFPYLQWNGMMGEMEQVFEAELDYRIEAGSIQRMRNVLKNHRIYAPEVYVSLSTQRILVMEFIDGVFLSDYIQVMRSNPEALAAWRAENGINPRRVARRLYLSLVRQMFEDNLFHGDLHPGNIVLLRNNSIALIDFGSVGTLDHTYMRTYGLYIQASLKQEYRKGIDYFLMLSSSLPAMDVPDVRQELARAQRQWMERMVAPGIPYHEKSIASSFSALVPIMLKHGIVMDWSFFKIHRTHLALDASLAFLFPEVDYLALFQRHFQAARTRALKRFFSREAASETAYNWMAFLADFPNFAQDWTTLGGSQLRSQALQGTTGKTAYFSEILFARLKHLTALTLLLALLALVNQHAPTFGGQTIQRAFPWIASLMPQFGMGVWIALIAALFYIYSTFRKLQRRFSIRDAHR